MRSRIAAITSGKSGEIYTALLDSIDLFPGKPHEFVRTVYRKYLRDCPNNPSINGRVFEYIICETILCSGIEPFYYQAQVALVPNADFDIVCYNMSRPVILSCKVSLRERYKQADLEGLVLRQVYRNAETYLLTLNHGEADSVQSKIDEGAISGLTACFKADTPAYTRLLKDLGRREFNDAEPIIPIQGKLVSA